jgi:hypothetical protein
MSEAIGPEGAAVRHARSDAVARAQRAGKPGASRLLGQMHDKVIASCSQRCEKFSFQEDSRKPGATPFAAHDMQLRQRRMALQHRRGVVVNQRIDFDVPGFERGQHRRGEQHVAVVPQLDHQRAPAFPQRDGVFHHRMAIATSDIVELSDAKDVGVGEPFALARFSGSRGDRAGEHRPGKGEGMELAALAAWIDALG